MFVYLKTQTNRIDTEIDSNVRTDPSESQVGTYISNEFQVGLSNLIKLQPGTSTLGESQAGYSDTNTPYINSSYSACPVITPDIVQPVPKALPRKHTGKLCEDKFPIIKETLEKY